MSLIMDFVLVSGLDFFAWNVVTPQKWGELAWACLLPAPGRFNQPCWRFCLISPGNKPDMSMSVLALFPL